MKTLKLLTAATVFAALAISVHLSAQTITTFNATGAGTASGQGTFPIGITPQGQGEIVGYYIDGSGVTHGFLRNKNGSFTTIDPPGSTGTFVYGINPSETTMGFYSDAVSVFHGFLRDRNGNYTTFEAPNAGTGPGQGTIAANINPPGNIAGEYTDSSGVSHAFLRTANSGVITSVDAPGAGTGAGQGTFSAGFDALNSGGQFAGSYLDSSNVFHCYVRASNSKGTITEFSAPGAGTGPLQGTNISGINGPGATTGLYVDSSGISHGFARSNQGVLTEFDVLPAGGTSPENINQSGAITGNYLDSSGVFHGFVRATNGAISTFNAPGAGTAGGQGTQPASNNDQGQITGFYIDASGVAHGFVRN